MLTRCATSRSSRNRPRPSSRSRRGTEPCSRSRRSRWCRRPPSERSDDGNRQRLRARAAPAEAYALLLDLERVAPCMPGATLGEEETDGSRKLTVTVRRGPMKFVYGGTVRIAERDDEAQRAVLVGAARGTRGQGSANARITRTGSGGGD